MANRIYTQFRYSLEKAVVDLFGKVTFGAAGSPTLSAVSSKGILSITRTGAGTYDIVLGTGLNRDVYNALLNMTCVFENATPPASPLMFVVSESVATPTTGKITVKFTNVAQVVTDPGNGEVILFNIALKNSTAQ